MANTPCPRDGGTLHTWVGASQPADQTQEMLTPLPAGPPTALALSDALDELIMLVEMDAFTSDVKQAIVALADGLVHHRRQRTDLLVWLADQERAGADSVLIENVRDGLR